MSPFTRANAKRGSVSRCTCVDIEGVAKVIEDADCRMCASALYASAAVVMNNGQWNGQESGSREEGEKVAAKKARNTWLEWRTSPL